VGRKLYRIIRGATPTLEDFKSARDLGKPLRSQRHEREWAEGVSTFDDLAYAIERAIQNRLLLGRYVATLLVPDDGSTEIAQTTRDRHHYSIYAPAEKLLSLVQESPIEVKEDP
jgi:hypothetical protein